MLIVHHLGHSQSERAVWLCEELGIQYELKRYDRLSSGLAPPDYKALHWIGTAPIIEDGGRVIGESGAVVEYVVARHGGGRLAPAANDLAFADYCYWLHYSMASLMPHMMVERFLGEVDAPDTFAGEVMRGRTDRGLNEIEARLGEVEWFAGAFSAADIMMHYPLDALERFARRDLAPYPNIRAFLARVDDRPARRRAMAKAEPGGWDRS